MFGLLSGVRLEELGERDGLIKGQCGAYQWEARLTRGPVSYGLDPQTLYKGRGRIARLILYERLSGTRSKRKVAAFDRGWLFGRMEHIRTVQRVVGYLEST
jgi:hypothetical protein